MNPIPCSEPARKLLFAAGLLYSLAKSAPAWGAPKPEPLMVDLVTVPGCPDVQELWRDLSSRAPWLRRARPGEKARTLRVVFAAGARFTGTVSFPEAGEGLRTFSSPYCEEVAKAVVVVVVLVGPTVGPHVAASSRGKGASPNPHPQTPRPLPADLPGSLPRLGDADIEPPPQPRARAAGWLHPFHAGVQLSLAQGVAPELLPGVRAFAEWRAPEAHPLALASLRTTVGREVGTTLAVAAGRGRFERLLLRGEGCLPPWLAGPLRAAACIALELGVITLATGVVRSTGSTSRSWMAAGAIARGEWTLFDPLFLEAEVGVLLRATQDRYDLPSGATLYLVPPVGLHGAIGFGSHFH